MGVIYKGINGGIKGVVIHGERVTDPLSTIIGTYEQGAAISENLAGFFSDEFQTYTFVSGNLGGLTFDPDFASISGTAGTIADYSFTITASNDGGPSETITFEYYVVPLHGLEPDYQISLDGQTASFAPFYTLTFDPGRILITSYVAGFTTNEDTSTYVSEQLVTESRPAEEYIWSGTLTGTGLTITSTGLVEGTIAVGASNDGFYGPFDLTVTSPFGDTATLELEVVLTFLS